MMAKKGLTFLSLLPSTVKQAVINGTVLGGINIFLGLVNRENTLFLLIGILSLLISVCFYLFWRKKWIGILLFLYFAASVLLWGFILFQACMAQYQQAFYWMAVLLYTPLLLVSGYFIYAINTAGFRQAK